MFLILGAYGQLGSCFRDKLNIKDFFAPTLEECDITSLDSLQNYAKGKNISAIINCAAYTNTAKAEVEEKELCYDINEKGAKNVALLSQGIKVPLIHISTDFVFGEKKDSEFFESDKTNPLNEYGKSKALGEQEVLQNAYKGAIIRVAYLYSVHGNNIVKTFNNLLKTKESIKVVKNQEISITNAHSLVDLCLLMLKKDSFKGVEIYHFAGKGSLSLVDLAGFIAKQINSNCKIEEILLEDYPSNIKRSHRTVLNCNKVEKDFNIQRNTWQEEMEKCLKKL